MASRELPTLTEVAEVVARIQPATQRQVLTALQCDWSQRGTIHNRLTELTQSGVLIEDGNRPRKYARNEFHHGIA